MKKLESVARKVWREFEPGDGEDLVCRDDGMIEVTVGGSIEVFDIDPDQPVGLLPTNLADRIQTIIMEARDRRVGVM